MTRTFTLAEAETLYDMGLISEEDYRQVKRLHEWRKTLRAGANSTAKQQEHPLRSCGGVVANG